MTGEQKRQQEIEEAKRSGQITDPGFGLIIVDKYLRHTVHSVGGHASFVCTVALTPGGRRRVTRDTDRALGPCRGRLLNRFSLDSVAPHWYLLGQRRGGTRRSVSAAEPQPRS